MSLPAAVLFDWDNTLVDSWVCIQTAMNRTLEAMGQPTWELAETKSRVARSMRDSFPQLFGERWQQARDVFYAAFAEIHLGLIQPIPGALETLTRLQKAGIPLGIISNKTGTYIRTEVAHLGWNGYFRHLSGAGDSAADKPSDVPVRDALAAIGVKAGGDVWFVGDASVDMQCAINAGVRPILVKHDPWREGEFDLYPPERHFNSWSAFGLYLDEIPVP